MAQEHVVTAPTPPIASASGTYEVHQVLSWQDNLVWLLVDKASGRAAAIDGPEAEGALEYCDVHGLELAAIFNTHTHHDHIGINSDVESRGMSLRVVGSTTAKDPIPGLTEGVTEGSEVTFGAGRGRVLLTEGHQNGHISYVFDDLLFCGDTLFGAGCGYLFDGPPAAMHQSLSRLGELPAETRVFCAHEYTEHMCSYFDPGHGVICWISTHRIHDSSPKMTSAQALNDPTMHDRRIAVRHRAMTAVSVDDEKVPDQAAVSVNISATGMLLRSQEPLVVGSEVNVSFRSPRDASRSVHVAGVIIREAGSHRYQESLFPHLAAVRFDQRLPLCDLPTKPMMTV